MSNEPTIRDIFYKLGALESKLDSVLRLQESDRERLDDLEKRTSHLEQVEAKRTGMIIVIVGVFSFLSSLVVKFISTTLNIN